MQFRLVIGVILSLLIIQIHCKSDEQFDIEYLWGTYQPQLVWGVTQRNVETFNPLSLSMMYFDPQNLNQLSDIRYRVPQRTTDETLFDYVHHDGKTYAEQQIKDQILKTKLRTTLLKEKITQDHQSWLSVTQSNLKLLRQSSQAISLVYVIGTEQLQSANIDTRYLTLQQNQGKQKNQLVVTVGNSGQEETFTFSVRTMLGSNYQVNYTLYEMDRLHAWNVSYPIFQTLKENFEFPYHTLKNNPAPGSTSKTVVAVQFIFQRNSFFEVQVAYNGKTQKQAENQGFLSLPRPLIAQIQEINNDDEIQVFDQEEDNEFDRFESLQKQKKEEIDHKLNSVFNFDKISHQYQQCAASSFANLLGGFQFTYGNLACVQENEITCTTQLPIFGHTPSRLGFPRPFMWDEGFHDMLTCQLDKKLCLQSLEDWINTVSQEGWIPREQPRGQQVYSFISWLKEDNREANPPTFMFDFLYLLQDHDVEIYSRIQALLPKLELWYNWWLQTQEVEEAGLKLDLFKWWGPNEEVNLGSGMDDWPRTDKDNVGRFNVDATSWGYYFTQSMAKIYKNFDEDKASKLQKKADDIKLKLNNYHLDQSDLIYQDVLIDNATRTHSVFSPHLGYPNFMPLALGIIDQNNATILSAQAKALLNENTLWTEYGLRSISKTDDYFGVGSNYWRGPIWINTHYLILRAIKLYYSNNADLLDVYQQLRANIVKTVCGNWEETGYFFEHFNQDLDGKGRGNHPFNGWTSLITLIINENYITP